jgi:hypothetical protein
MTSNYEHAVDELLDAIRLHLQRQHDREPTDTAIADYITHTEPAEIYHDLHHYPNCQAAARHLKPGRTNTPHILYVMLWGRVTDGSATARSDAEARSNTQHDDTSPAN